MNSTPIYLHQAGICCALGNTIKEVDHALFSQNITSPLRSSDDYSPGKPIPLGRVKDIPDVAIGGENTRNNRILAQAVLPMRQEIEALIKRLGSHRIGIIIGTSTSGIAECEDDMQVNENGFYLSDDYHYRNQELAASSRFLAHWLGIDGPCWSVSSACTSGGKALASAARLLKTGMCDAVIAGGVDSLCRMTVNGFDALAVTTQNHCNPFSANRDGVNLGEGAAVFIVSREHAKVRLAGYGETSDAHHISSPDPEGKGAEAAIRKALHNANLQAADIDYINLHGTATLQNDLMEGTAIHRVFNNDVPCSSTKPLTGHTLAAAGAIEAAFCWLTVQREDKQLPPHLWDGIKDSKIPGLTGLGCPGLAPAKAVMSNSFAFGGNNLSLIMTRECHE
ncbi:3-oxoacyl-[acyl-carrier-protein] synthase 2 [Zhongshania aliphaticivorans]|uniref:3-oxoacyl-[acyl-carrier-protein] synthase 2 n=1 Tax=Zhongshania aliphaticivorans TaxID=1470434 RepID=A0A5S9NLM1_9GAMM|nr:beta-ketoacyl-ACP synthase [Zhongshania aliphaticivorans]CAA0091632.1 3-oxoacyl-[acyl-carrier-protein] synthase 2 [Zhongshania aliphaticivorans]CAA0098979.1 3-oxoacyl-[acyl-carrier-protein] synthase 2 [Zhongshania aliphaticivorans]